MKELKTISVSEFRKNVRGYMEEAIHEPVYIERGGIIFAIKRHGFTSHSAKDMVITEVEDKPDGTVSLSGQVIEAEYCPIGHRCAPGTDRCLAKGCKYSARRKS